MTEKNITAADVFHGTDRDEAQSRISSVFSPHVLDAIDKSCDLHVHLSTTVLPANTLGLSRQQHRRQPEPRRLPPRLSSLSTHR